MLIGKLRALGLLALLGLLPALASAEAETTASKASYYNAQLDVSINGKSLMAPVVDAEFGKEVEVSLTEKSGHTWRVRFTVNQPFVTKDGLSAVLAKAQLFDVAGDAQTLAAEPELLLALGEQGEISFPLTNGSDLAGRLSMTVQVRSAADLQSQLGEAFGKSSSTGCITQDVSTAGETFPAKPRRCCGIRCSDGEAATCCGAIQCCVCGGCCSP